jgi:hypothetical protein
MEYFNLPTSTTVQRVVPKNSFDPYTTKKQKELLARYVSKIIWRNNLSPETINLPGREVREIQIFTIELKVKREIAPILNIIDRAIPYHIIFVVEFDGWCYLSTSAKHPSPLDESKSIIDWTFESEWFEKTNYCYPLELKKSLDDVFCDFCNRLSIKPDKEMKNIPELISYNAKLHALNKAIESLKKKIASCNQFNKKVDLNLKLKKLEEELNLL